MKLALIASALALPGLLVLGWLRPVARSGHNPAAARPAAGLATARQLPGTVLAAPYRVLRSPVAGRVVRTYFNEGQTVPASALLLKLAVGAGAAPQTVFATAPAAGDLSRTQVSEGQYLATGAPYARLTPRGPVRVRVLATGAARLRLGDSLRVLTGPVGLVGHTTPLTALVPDSTLSTVVLVLGHLGWPPGTAVRLVLAPGSAQRPAITRY